MDNLPFALQNILKTLKRGPMDVRELGKATGQPVAALRAYVTRLVFLGAVEMRNGRYTLTPKGQEALSGSATKTSAYAAVIKGLRAAAKALLD